MRRMIVSVGAARAAQRSKRMARHGPRLLRSKTRFVRGSDEHNHRARGSGMARPCPTLNRTVEIDPGERPVEVAPSRPPAWKTTTSMEQEPPGQSSDPSFRRVSNGAQQKATLLGRRADRRRRKRYFAIAAYCEVLPPHTGTVPVVDLSAFGACLSIHGTVAVGTVLHLRLSNREQLLRHEVALRITHIRGVPGRSCIAGGTFEKPLPPDVLHALMR
jgi:hypothetical protein